MATMVKTRRFEARLNPDADDLITQAAELLGQSRSEFVVRAAVESAELVLARSDVTLIAAEDFAAIVASLDQPWSLPWLEQTAGQPKPVTREAA